MTDTATTIVWFRQDLRLADNPALSAAAKAGTVVPLYILDHETPGKWQLGGASRWWLHESLEALAASLEKLGSKLILRRGHPAKILDDVIRETKATAVVWNRQYEPFAIARDKGIKAALEQRGIEVTSFNGSLIAEPWTIATGSDGPFRVFTPFWRALSRRVEVPSPLAVPKRLAAPTHWPKSDKLKSWDLQPTRPNWAKGIAAAWTPGEAAARKRLAAFVDDGIAVYPKARDQLDAEGTSRLSPHLHWGEISPRQVWHAAEAAKAGRSAHDSAAEKFLSEIGWREFSYHLLFHFPHLPERNYRPAFDAFEWEKNTKAFKAWTKGMTGYPVVDAGMRELWATGYMHNRARMIAASFLTKHLLIPWQKGAAWFWDTLVDADLANNSASWQWVAGSGADAAPYFRIFNPTLQGEKYDADGEYVRRWVPELRNCDAKHIHRPWLSSNFAALAYPERIVDHDRARERALKAFAAISRGQG